MIVCIYMLTVIETAVSNMDAGSSKFHKCTQMASIVEEDTINSKLPESLVNRVLSFLPTKDVVRTCVLSKRWMNRWTSSITKLDIDDIDLSYNYNPVCSYCEEICTDYCYDYDKVSFLPLVVLFDSPP